MKILESYGNPIVAYEGRISIDAEDEGYFEAIQVARGRITVGCFWPYPTTQSTLQPGSGTWALDAKDRGGWTLKAEGVIFCGKLTHHSSGMTYATLTPARLRAIKMPVIDEKLAYLKTRFAIANLLLWEPPDNLVHPVELTAEGWDIVVTPEEEYEGSSERLRTASGIEHTAFLELQRSDGTRTSLDEAVKFMEEFVPALRLWSGNKLDWLYGDGLDDSGTESFERLHKNSIVGGYSQNLHHAGWTIPLDQFVESYFNGSQLLERKELRELIAYFVDACASGPYLEIRALQLATLLDVVTSRLSTVNFEHEIISELELGEIVLPGLKKEIDATNLPKATKDQLKINIQGIYRTSFRRRLRGLATRLKLDMNKSFMNLVIETRNSLVHEGRFPTKDTEDRKEWLSRYHSLLWTDAGALCRIVGYTAQLPSKP